VKFPYYDHSRDETRMNPDELFTEVYNRMLEGWHEVWSFREVSMVGLQVGWPHVVSLKEKFLKDLASGPDFQQIVRNPEEFAKIGFQELASRTARMSVGAAKTAVDSASLIFIHSIVDAGAVGLLRAISAVDPSGWERFLDDKKLAVSDVRKQGYEALYFDLLASELNNIERSFSLPKKADRLHHFCQPESGWGLWPYNRDELCRIDKLRHDIIHGDKLGKEIPTIEKDLDFMQNAGSYFLNIVGRRYGLRIIFE
jgi:hypothetical protein